MDMRIILKSALILCAFYIVTGCGEPVADLNNTKTYDKYGISFKYPGNWTVSDKMTGDISSISLETPGDTVVIIQNYPVEYSMNLKKYANEFSKSMAENLPIGNINNQKILSSSESMIDEEFSISLIGEKVPHRRKFVSKNTEKSTCFLIYQVPKEDFEKSQKGFELINSSLDLK